MEKIAIYGYGGFSKDVVAIIEEINNIEQKFNFIGYFDDIEPIEFDCMFLGDIKKINDYPEILNIVLAFGKPSILKSRKLAIKNKNIKFPNLIHPKANIYFKGFNSGIGNVINVGTVIGKDVIIENFNVINSNCVIGHDVKIGSFNVISPQVAISGNVKVANNVFFGLNSSVVQSVIIEDDVQIGAKSLILKKAKKGNFYFGLPAVKMNK